MNQEQRDEILLSLRNVFFEVKDEVSNLSKRFDKLEKNQEELKAEIQEVRKELKAEIQEIREELQRVGNIVVKIEADYGEKLQVLLDTFTDHREYIESHEERLCLCERRIDILEIKSNN